MPRMGRYCKAYPLSRFREFGNWTENTQNLRKASKDVDGKSVEVEKELTGDDFLYLQENYLVTDGVFIEENIIFDNVTDEWVFFCKNTLKFEVPDYLLHEPPAAANA